MYFRKHFLSFFKKMILQARIVDIMLQEKRLINGNEETLAADCVPWFCQDLQNELNSVLIELALVAF